MNSVAPHPAAAKRSPVSPGDRKLWRVIQRVAGLLLVAVGLVMCFDYLQARREDPLESPKLKALKEDLRATPTSEPLKQQIRELDLKLRESYFRHITRMASGVWLILGAGAVWLFATSRSRPKAHAFDFLRTRPAVSDNPREKSVALWAVGLTGAATAVFLAWLSVGAQRSTLPIHIAEVDALLGGSPDAAAAPDCASDADLERNWARFRGPGGNGVALSGKAPTSWNAESDAGIAWKVPSPVAGYNSPIIFGDSIYFSGGEASKLEVVCLRLNDGQLVWRQTVEPPPGSGETGEVPESTGYAPSTMATDGRRVYAMFANGVLAALTMDGKPVWSKSFGALSNPYGHAISLATHRDRVLVQLDQGESGEGKSVLYMFDGRTGRPAWETPRPLGASWASPIIIHAAGKDQVITLSVPMAIAYSADNGKEIWRADCLNGEVTPSPIFAGERFVITSPSDRIMAFRPDGQDDITQTHMEWEFDEDIPDVTSPVSNGELLFYVSTSGTITCLDMKDGKKLWNHELSFQCHASPAISGGLLYQFGQDGSAVIVEAGREYKEVFRTAMPDSFHASPAFVHNSILVRGMSNIWCLGPISAPLAKGGESP